MDPTDALCQAVPHFMAMRGHLSLSQQKALTSTLAALAKGHTAIHGEDEPSEFVQRQEGLLALTSLALAEESIALDIQQRYCASLIPATTGSNSAVSDGLSDEQKEAALRALSSKIFLLEGGPGTGKTFTAAWILQRVDGKRWLALAPTGKAKAQLEHSLGRYGLRSDWTMTVQAALSRHTRDEGLLDADVILVDESSMLDSLLFYRLLKALRPSSCLLLLGDRHQLPPVGPGQPFADLCRALEGSPLHRRLGTSKRAEVDVLLHLADAVRRNSPSELPIRPLGSSDSTANALLQFHRRRLPLDLQNLVACLGDRMVLGALQEGPWGVESLQSMLLEETVDPDHPLRPVPMMVTSNIERADLWNGDLGWLCRPAAEAPFVVMPNRTRAGSDPKERRGVRKFSLASLPSWDYAWMLTVHKAQGSEFQRVAVILPPGSEQFGQELLYTAVTRARREVEIWSWTSVVERMLAQREPRRTWLQRLLSSQGDRAFSMPLG